MLDQTSDENAINIAFNNIIKIHEQIAKIIDETDKQFKEINFYPNLKNSNAICRWRSDLITQIHGWCVSGIARPYCFVNEGENVEENKKQIVININMERKIPLLSFGLFIHEQSINNRKFGIGDHWELYWPFHSHENKNFDFNKENEYFIRSKPNTDKTSKSYNGLIDNLFTTIRLFNIQSSEALNSLVIIPSLELYNNGKFVIDSVNSDNFIKSDEYFELFE